jgi:hypothetical protein
MRKRPQPPDPRHELPPTLPEGTDDAKVMFCGLLSRDSWEVRLGPDWKKRAKPQPGDKR